MPDNNYILFEKWIFPIFKQMLLEQETQVQALHCEHTSIHLKQAHKPDWVLTNYEVIIPCCVQSMDTNHVVRVCVCLWCFLSQGTHWTPSKMIHRFGKEINDPDSVCYWAYKVKTAIQMSHLWPLDCGEVFFLKLWMRFFLVTNVSQEGNAMLPTSIAEQRAASMMICFNVVAVLKVTWYNVIPCSHPQGVALIQW